MLIFYFAFLLQLLKIDLLGYPIVCGPILINENHWTGFFARMDTSEYVFLDPNGYSKVSMFREFEKWRFVY